MLNELSFYSEVCLLCWLTLCLTFEFQEWSLLFEGVSCLVLIHSSHEVSSMVDLDCVGDSEICLCVGVWVGQGVTNDMGITLTSIFFFFFLLGVLMYLLILICLLNSLSEFLFCLRILVCRLLATCLPAYHVSGDFA